MAFTVTATPGGASFNRTVGILVRVLTNATESGGAGNGGRNTAAGTAGGSLTPNFSSSFVGFSVTSDAITTMPAAATNNTYDINTGTSNDQWAWGAGHYTGTVTASTPLTYGAGSAGAGDHENWCAYEVPASGGTITVDGSSPAAVFADTGATATTASFSPPVGAVLLVMVAAGGTGLGAGVTCAITDTSGTGMVWTQRVTSSTSDNFQPVFIFTATVPPVTAPFTRSAVAQTSRTWQRRWTRTVRPVIPPQVQQITARAGVATAQATANPGNFRPYIAGLGGSGYNSYFADQYGSPRLAVIEQGWALPFNAGRWNSGNAHADFVSYFSNRSAQGYTAWYGVAWGSTHVDSTATGGKSWDGNFALTVNGTPGNIATGAETVALNGTFWSRIDDMFAVARNYGISCFLNMGLTYDFSDAGAIWQHATNTQATAFGTALATRYPQSQYPHVFWFFGDDDGGGNDSFWSAMLSGMASAGDTRPLIAIEYLTNENSHVEYDTGAPVGTFGAASATYNWVYSYDAPYFGVERSYTEGGTFAHIPPVYGDGIYYGDSGGGPSVETAIRTFVWWALASGSRGFASTSGPSFGDNDALWMWKTANAPGRVTSDPNGSWTTTNVGRIATYISGLPDWHKLIPDTSNVFITAGRGTRGTCDAPASGFNVRTGNTYVAGSITPGGTLAVIYCRASLSITIDQTKMNAGYTATWVDPSNPTLTQSATTGSTYASGGLGNNAAGDPDWVLVLQAPPAVNASAGVATATGTALAPVAAESVPAGVATATGTAPAPVASVAPHAAVASSSAVSLPPLAAAAISAAVAAATGVSLAPVAAVTVIAAVATASGVALQPVVNTSGNTNAPAGVAVATGSAPAPQAAITTASAVAAGSGSAPAPQTALAIPGAVAAAAATARAPVPALAVLPAGGTGQATALAATVSASNAGTANAGVATASGVALAPTRAVTISAAVASGQALALAAVIPPQFTIGRLTASTTSGGAGGTLTASDQRTGGPS